VVDLQHQAGAVLAGGLHRQVAVWPPHLAHLGQAGLDGIIGGKTFQLQQMGIKQVNRLKQLLF